MQDITIICSLNFTAEGADGRTCSLGRSGILGEAKIPAEAVGDWVEKPDPESLFSFLLLHFKLDAKQMARNPSIHSLLEAFAKDIRALRKGPGATP